MPTPERSSGRPICKTIPLRSSTVQLLSTRVVSTLGSLQLAIVRCCNHLWYGSKPQPDRSKIRSRSYPMPAWEEQYRVHLPLMNRRASSILGRETSAWHHALCPCH